MYKQSNVLGDHTLPTASEKLELLARLSNFIAEAEHPDLVVDRILDGARQLTGCANIYLYTCGGSPVKKGPVLRGETGLSLSRFQPQERALLEAARDRATGEKRALVFDCAPLRGNLFPRENGVLHGLACPLNYGGVCFGSLVLVDSGSPQGTFAAEDVKMLEILTHQAGLSLKNAEFREVQINFYTHTIELLVLSMEGTIVPRDHNHNVARYTDTISRKMGFSEKERRDLHFAALLHDLGMIKIPSELHSSPEHYRLHSLLGAEMVGRIVLWEDLVPAVRFHHENFDGSGYPDGLRGNEIPVTARILTIAESFDAMTNPNSYRSLLTYSGAMRELAANAGTRYDPELIGIFETELKAMELIREE